MAYQLSETERLGLQALASKTCWRCRGAGHKWRASGLRAVVCKCVLAEVKRRHEAKLAAEAKAKAEAAVEQQP
jgi:hypothetical protein